MGRLAKKDQVHECFGAPVAEGADFEEFRTRRKISEPKVASVNFILGAESAGLFELWNFPAAILSNMWHVLVGQTLRFEYGTDGKVQRVLINGTPMDQRADLP